MKNLQPICTSQPPAPAERHASTSRHYGPVPALGEHTAKVRAKFLAAPVTPD